MFQGEQLATAMAVPLYYGLLEAVILGLYCIVAWKLGWTKAPKDINFFTMVGTSFEVLTTEHGDLVAIEVSLPKNQKDLMEKTKIGSDGDVLHLKHSLDECDKDEEMNCDAKNENDNFFDAKLGWKCLTENPIFPDPTKPKEPSGLQLPQPTNESDVATVNGINRYNLWDELEKSQQPPGGPASGTRTTTSSQPNNVYTPPCTPPRSSLRSNNASPPRSPGMQMQNLWEQREKMSPRNRFRS